MIGMAIKRVIGGNVVILGLLAGIVTLAWGWDSSRKARWVEKGRSEERARVIEKGAVNAAKADAARRSADRIPAGRLCDRYARDC